MQKAWAAVGPPSDNLPEHLPIDGGAHVRGLPSADIPFYILLTGTCRGWTGWGGRSMPASGVQRRVFGLTPAPEAPGAGGPRGAASSGEPRCVGCSQEARARCILSAIPPEVIPEFAPLFCAREYDEGEELFAQGAHTGCTWILCSGLVKLWVYHGANPPLLLGIARAGDLLDVAGAGQHPYSARAAGPVVVTLLPPGAQQALARRWPELTARMSERSGQACRILVERLAHLAGSRLYTRVAGLLVQLLSWHGRGPENEAVEIPVPLTQGDLALMVGASRQAVGTVLREMEVQRVIVRRGRYVRVLRPEQLRALARGESEPPPETP